MIVLELIAGLVVAVVGVTAVLEPILKRQPDADVGGVLESIDEDVEESPRARALAALTEIEFDRATGKLDDDDYQALKAKYTQAALAALRVGEEAEGGGEQVRDTSRDELDEVAEARIAAARRGVIPTTLACSRCGPRPEPDAVFCSNCGKKVA